MAYTVEIIVTPGSGNVTATARSGGTGTANSSGYAITQVAGNLHTITIAEELLGPWALTAGDENSMRLVTFSESKSEYLLSGPTDANVTHVLGEPAPPADDVAKQDTLLEVQAAVEAVGDLPEEEDVRAGVEYGGGLYVGVLDVGTGLPIPEYPPGSTGL